MIIWEPSLGSPCGCWRCRTPAGSATLSVSAVTVARSVSLNAASCVDASFLLRLLRRAPSSDEEEEEEDEDEDDDDEDEERRLLRRRFFSREFERPRRCRLSLSRPPASRPPPLRRSLLRDLDPRFLPSLPSFDRPRCLLRLEEGFSSRSFSSSRRSRLRLLLLRRLRSLSSLRASPMVTAAALARLPSGKSSIGLEFHKTLAGPMMFEDSPRRAPSHTVARSGSQRTPVRDAESYPLRSIHRRADADPIDRPRSLGLEGSDHTRGQSAPRTEVNDVRSRGLLPEGGGGG